MKRVRTYAKVLVAAAVLGGTAAASALAALPTVLFLSGEGAPVTVEGSVTGGTQLKGSQNLTGKGGSLKFTLPSGTSSLGMYTAEAKGVREEAGARAACSTPGDASEVMLVTGNEGHLVFDTLSPVLGVAGLFVIPTYLLSCNDGALDFKISGSLLGLVTPLNTEVLTTGSFKSKLHCVAGKSQQEDIHYFNKAGVELTAKLNIEVGGTTGNGCTEVDEETPLKPSKMIELMG